MAWRDGLADAARVLGTRGDKPLPFEPRWQRLEARVGARPEVAAVDGSHALLVDNGAAWVVATRAAAVHWPGTRVPELPIDVTASGPDEAAGHLGRLYGRHGIEAPEPRSAEAFAEAIRAVAEAEAALRALQAMSSGSLLLLDGALERLPKHATAWVERILEAAGRHDIAVAGVAKRSRLDADGVPLVPALRRASREAVGDGAWAVAVPGYSMTYVAQLHAQAQHAFRVDVTDVAALGDLLPMCRDAVYTGYPYPLAAAHNAVAISQAMARRLRERLADEVRKQGGSGWHMLLDFHDVLDRNAPRL